MCAGSNSVPPYEDPSLTARPRNVCFPPLTVEAVSNFKTFICMRKKGLLGHKQGDVCNRACLCKPSTSVSAYIHVRHKQK